MASKWAYVCSRCDHLATRHRDREHNGTYPCLHCDCVMLVSDATYGLDRRRAEALHADEIALNRQDYGP